MDDSPSTGAWNLRNRIMMDDSGRLFETLLGLWSKTIASKQDTNRTKYQDSGQNVTDTCNMLLNLKAAAEGAAPADAVH